MPLSLALPLALPAAGIGRREMVSIPRSRGQAPNDPRKVRHCAHATWLVL